MKHRELIGVYFNQQSLPVRGRGLKLSTSLHAVDNTWSLPVRGRGLKHASADSVSLLRTVAPRAGAWIETPKSPPVYRRPPSLPVRGRGLKLVRRLHVDEHPPSLPVRGRGLKRQKTIHLRLDFRVAPRAGAWIETPSRAPGREPPYRRSPCGGVD